jgi:hypothetical protein
VAFEELGDDEDGKARDQDCVCKQFRSLRSPTLATSGASSAAGVGAVRPWVDLSSPISSPLSCRQTSAGTANLSILLTHWNEKKFPIFITNLCDAHSYVAVQHYFCNSGTAPRANDGRGSP